MNIKSNHAMRSHKRLLEASPPDALSSRTGGKNIRVGTNDPILYKALRKVNVRSGKPGDKNSVSWLPKGSVATINRINGRSGRVAVQQQNVEYTKTGWVTLHTQDKLPLLEKFSPAIAPSVGNRSLAFQTTSIEIPTE